MGLKDLVNQIRDEQKEQNKTTGEKFLGAMDSYILKGVKDVGGRKAFRPSSYYKCPRQVYYFLTGQKGKLGGKSARLQRIFAVGTQLHELFQDGMIMEYNKCEDFPIRILPAEELPRFEHIEVIRQHGASDMEVKFLDRTWTNEFPVSAMVDGWVEFENTPMLLEFKTINTKDFEFLNQPLVDHRKQGAIYALCTGVMTVMFVYMNKNNQEWKAFDVTYTEEQLQWVKDTLSTIEGHVLRGDPPAIGEAKDCRFCPYKAICSEDEKALLGEG